MTDEANSAPVQPILVVLVWRGGARFQRALDSVRGLEDCFKRVIFSITSDPDSDDVHLANRYLAECETSGRPSKAEVICTGTELPTMKHQEFWIDYLTHTFAKPDDRILWLAYDDELRASGIRSLMDDFGNWRLDQDATYFGPWAMRHESADQLWDGPRTGMLESWTSFPVTGPSTLPVCDWVRRQLIRPTYMQMSGSIAPLSAHSRLVKRHPRKSGPMRIELATALSAGATKVSEFDQPISIIYGRPNSDRANYAKTARREDLDLAFRLLPWLLRDPKGFLQIMRAACTAALHRNRASENWDIRDSSVAPG